MTQEALKLGKNYTDCHNARKYTAEEREDICGQLMVEAQYWDLDYYLRMMHDSTKRPLVGLTDEDMNDPRTHNFDFIHGARWAEAKLKEKNT